MQDIIYDSYKSIKKTKGLNYRIVARELGKLSFLPHCHDFYEMEFLTEGVYEHMVDGKTYTEQAPSIHLISPLSFHGIRIKSDNCKMFHIIFLSDAVPPNMIEKLLGVGGFSCIELSDKQYEQFNYEMSFFFDEHKEYEEGMDDSIIKNAFERILLLFLRDAKKANATHNDPVLQDILSFLHKNFRNKITLKDIAGVANMSPTYFCAYFSQKMNLTFVEYLNSLRVNFAASMLLMPNSTVKKVALECGFSSASYFSEVFLKTYGMTPTEFKAKNKGII